MKINYKNYSALLKGGVPSVIDYHFKRVEIAEIEFEEADEIITYDRKDIYNSPDTPPKIDITKNYISIF